MIVEKLEDRKADQEASQIMAQVQDAAEMRASERHEPLYHALLHQQDVLSRVRHKLRSRLHHMRMQERGV